MAKSTTPSPKYYKLGVLSSIFFDPATRLKVTKNVPGILTVSANPTILEASSKGHIQEIDKDTYDEMLAQHDVNVEVNNTATMAKQALKKGKKAVLPKSAPVVQAEEPEAEEPEANKDKPTRDELIEEIMDNDNIPDDEKTKKALKKLDDAELQELIDTYS